MSAKKGLWLASVIIGIIGIIDAAYLSILKLTHNESTCIKGIGDCFSVNTSSYSQFHGIPVALFGVVGYALMIVLLLLEIYRQGFWAEYAPIFVFGISIFGVLYSAYLTYLEIAVIRAICPFCIISALAMLALLLLSIIRLPRGQVSPIS